MKNNVFIMVALCLSVLTTSRAQTLPAYLPSDGLVGWWPFNGNANDESGNGNNGTVNGATLAEDRFGNANRAFHFNGFSEIQTQSPGPTGTGISLSYWYKSNDLNQMQTISYGSTNWGGYFGAYLNHYSAQTTIPCYGPSFTNAGTLVNKNTGIIIDTTSWHHAVIIIPDVALDLNSVMFYLDGNLLIGNCSFANYGAPSPNIDGGNPIKIGAGWYTGFPYNNFNGELDDIAFFDRPLTPEEITSLYTGEPLNPPTTCNPLPANLQNGLVGYWPFCGNANDESGNGNDGTVNGATLAEDRFGDINSAYFFDGINDFISIADNVDLRMFPGDFTVSVWYKIQSYGLPNRNFIIKTDGPGPSNKWVIQKTAVVNGGPSLSLHSNGALGSHYVNAETLEDTLWHQMTIIHAGPLFQIYEDGIQLSNTTSFQMQTSNADIRIGGDEISGGGHWHHGSLDDIGIWNRALTPEEVQQLYTLNACTFTVYDTLTVENVVNVFDTTTVTETLYDTVTVIETLYETVYDTVTTFTTVTDTLIINTLITAINPPNNSNTIKVFPNPAGSFITIDYGNFALMNGYQLRIENSLGQQVFQTNISQQSDYLSLATWGGNGLYFVHIVDPLGNTIDIRKIVLQ